VHPGRVSDLDLLYAHQCPRCAKLIPDNQRHFFGTHSRIAVDRSHCEWYTYSRCRAIHPERLFTNRAAPEGADNTDEGLTNNLRYHLMSQANHASTTARDCAASPSEISEMIDALDAVDPRPPLTNMAAWIAEGVEAAAETRAAERRRASLMNAIYGDLDGVAA
jgi:hypothetical protein